MFMRYILKRQGGTHSGTGVQRLVFWKKQAVQKGAPATAVLVSKWEETRVRKSAGESSNMVQEPKN